MATLLAWRVAGVVLLFCAVVASDSVAAEVGSSKSAGHVILYASNWEGPAQIFAADAAGRVPVRQVTFVPPTQTLGPVQFPGQVALPSPDGRHLLYYTAASTYSSALWLSRADGRAPRVIAAGTWAAAWSPDSSRFAYLADCCQTNSLPSRTALHVSLANGSSDRIVGSASNYPYGVQIVWSPDGRHVKAGPIENRMTRSPDGKWQVFDSGIYRADGPRVQDLGSTISELAWSPDSRYLAYVGSGNDSNKGIHVFDTRGRRARLLSRDVGCFLAWSPDGQLLAYAQGTHYSSYRQQTDCASVGDLRTVTPDGHTRVVAAAGGPYPPLSSYFAWARVPQAVSYRAPSHVAGVYTGSRVTALAADGDRVAYATCAGVFTWDTASDRPIKLASSIVFDNCVDIHEGISDIALASDRLAYVDAYGGNTTVWSVRDVSLGTLPYTSSELASGSNTAGPPDPEVGGSGGLLTLATRAPVTISSSDLLWHIQTVGPSGCPCQEILSFQQPRPDRYAHLDDVDSDRVVVNGGGFVRILDGDGMPLLALPLQASEAALSGNDLVVHVDGALRDYSASTGALLHTWPAEAAQQRFPSILQDVAHGLAAYVVNGELHLLRLSDGSDTVIGFGSLARFADAGLVDAAGARVQLIPYGKLPPLH